MSNKTIVFGLFNDNFANRICDILGYMQGKLHIHQFPDQEIKIQIETPVENADVIIITSLNQPNEKIAPLFFTADTARALGAKTVKLIAPYLAYMRQDKQFNPGEGVTSQYFAKMISSHFDSLITIDPHLHRWHSLDDIFTIPTQVLHAAETIGQWIKQNISQPLLIGPDAESRQWVAEVSAAADAPFLVAEKQRLADRSVSVFVPNIATDKNDTLVLIDDIISTGETMLATVNYLKTLGMKNIYCIGIHAIFSAQDYQKLSAAAKVITCNTIAHPSNRIDVSHMIIDALK